MQFDLDTYLGRLGVDAMSAGAAGLKQMQSAQLQAIPFENTASLLGEVPDLSPEAIWRKLVADKRGGYCFELNGLLGRALEAAGHEPRAVLGRVRMGEPSGGPRSHLAWIVGSQGREWLVDAGFGGPGPVEPLEIEQGAIQEIAGVRFRLRPDEATGELVLEREAGESWFALYGFDRVPVYQPDIEAANFMCARWEHTPFPSNLMLNVCRPDGRVSLFNTAAKIEKNGEETDWAIGSSTELHDAMRDLFSLPYDEAIVASIWRRIASQQAERAA